jgi:acyl-coenzyme A thioesterase PaaI-like protein
MNDTPIQHYYPEDVSHCFGCGRLNEFGHQIKTFWDGKQSVSGFRPKEYHIALPGYVYGGLIASLIDCHGTGTAAAAMAEKRRIDLTEQTAPRFVTASLQVQYRKPTPIGKELKLIGRVREITDRKVVVIVELSADGVVCAEGTVIAVELTGDL